MARPHRRFELLAEISELFGAQIADRAQIEALLRPKHNVDALHALDPCAVLHFRALRNEQVYEVVVSAVHDRRDWLTEDIVDPPTDQIEAFRGQVRDGWCNPESIVEPGLDPMPVAAPHVG